jgi:hypothetical protein
MNSRTLYRAKPNSTATIYPGGEHPCIQSQIQILRRDRIANQGEGTGQNVATIYGCKTPLKGGKAIKGMTLTALSTFFRLVIVVIGSLHSASSGFLHGTVALLVAYKLGQSLRNSA